MIRQSQKVKKEKEQLKKFELKEFCFGKNKNVMTVAKDYKEPLHIIKPTAKMAITNFNPQNDVPRKKRPKNYCLAVEEKSNFQDVSYNIG